jgi:hypothetical protein
MSMTRFPRSGFVAHQSGGSFGKMDGRMIRFIPVLARPVFPVI